MMACISHTRAYCITVTSQVVLQHTWPYDYQYEMACSRRSTICIGPKINDALEPPRAPYNAAALHGIGPRFNRKYLVILVCNKRFFVFGGPLFITITECSGSTGIVSFPSSISSGVMSARMASCHLGFLTCNRAINL